MSTRDPQSFLHDVLGAIANIETFTSGKTFEHYLADDMLRSAVERQLTIIGEAIAQLSKADRVLSERLLDSPKIVAFRNRLKLRNSTEFGPRNRGSHPIGLPL